LGARKSLQVLGERAYDTYRSRLQAEKRLRKVGLLWAASQTALAVATIAVSVLYVAYPDSQSKLMLVYLVSLSILALAVSVTIASRDYSGRAREMFRNYRSLQALSVKIEARVLRKVPVRQDALDRLQRHYDLLLDSTENHSSVDFEIYQSEKRRTANKSNVIAIEPGLALRRSTSYLLPVGLIAISAFTLASAVVTVW
jgi:hypothetical protein